MDKDKFYSMRFDEQIEYLIENLKGVPDELAKDGVELLVQAGETEYAVVLARDKGLISRAIEILLESGDYLWAALIAKNASMAGESERLYREGLGYYIDMEMYGRAISAAAALKLPPEEIDALFKRGIEVESRGMDREGARAMIDSVMESLEISLMGRDDDISKELRRAINEEKDKQE